MDNNSVCSLTDENNEVYIRYTFSCRAELKESWPALRSPLVSSWDKLFNNPRRVC